MDICRFEKKTQGYMAIYYRNCYFCFLQINQICLICTFAIYFLYIQPLTHKNKQIYRRCSLFAQEQNVLLPKFGNMNICHFANKPFIYTPKANVYRLYGNIQHNIDFRFCNKEITVKLRVLSNLCTIAENFV